MGLGNSPISSRLVILAAAWLAICGRVGIHAASVHAQEVAPAASGPQPFSTPQNAPKSDEIGEPVEDVWYDTSLLRVTDALLYDNGPPLDEFGHPASQLSQTPPPNDNWAFIAAAADDFQFTDNVSPNTAVRITTVRVATHFFQAGSAGATPTTTWTDGVYVTIYSDTPSHKPSGQPNASGGQTGTFVTSQLVPMASLTNQTLVNTCRTAYVVDIPVNILLTKNTKYWLSVVPKFNAPPQSAWVISANANPTTSVAQVFFPVAGFPNWTDNPGNINNQVNPCPNAPPDHSRRDLSFQFYGVNSVTSFGACCNGLTGQCTVVDSAAQCAGPNQSYTSGATCQTLNPPCTILTGACCTDQGVCTENVPANNCAATGRFAANATCGQFVPPCGDNTLGACCLANGACNDLSALDCDNQNGTWHAGTCATFACPPPNDDCLNRITITGDTVVFDTTGATDSAPDDGTVNCGTPKRDLWYSYTSPCTGTLFIALCQGTAFDSILAVYDGCVCPPDPMGARLACDNDGCGPAGGPSAVNLPVTQGNCYLIRIGGSGTASGPGTMRLACIPTGSGACCHANHQCTIETAANCATPDVFTADQPCSPVTCPPVLTGACCFDPPPCQENMTQSDCELAGGIYGGDGTTCADPCAPPPTGACCLSTGVCEQHTETECGGMSGDFQGPGTSCTPNPCPEPTGACCLADQVCQILTNNDCLAQSGSYQGDGMLCSPLPCHPANDECANAINVSEGDTPFNSTGATDSPPPDGPPCPAPLKDVWFKYVAACTGQLQIGLCPGTTFHARVSAYLGGDCPALGTLYCDFHPGGCGPGQNTAGFIQVTAFDVVWIRIGSTDSTTGAGILRIHCQPANSCCPGDMNTDGFVDTNDISDFVLAVMTPPGTGQPEFCRADINGDNLVNGLDVVAFTNKIMSGQNCSTLGACCFPDGHCELREEGPCKNVNGEFSGPGTNCNPNLCATATGACCLPGNNCQIQSFADCVANNGFYQGDNAQCTPNPCAPPPPPNCCKGDSDQNGTIDEQDVDDFVAIVLDPSGPGFTANAVCSTDMNCDAQVNGLDIAGFITMVLQGPHPCPTCCPGDSDGNGTLNGSDIGAFIQSLLAVPSLSSCDPAFCRADVDGNGSLNLSDADAIVTKLLAGDVCPP